MSKTTQINKYDAMGSADSTTELALRALYDERVDNSGDDLVARYYASSLRFSVEIGRADRLTCDNASVSLGLDGARALHRFLGYVLGVAEQRDNGA